MHDAQHGFLFFLRTHFTAFCKINKYFIWYQRSLFLLHLFSKPSGADFHRGFAQLWLILKGRGGPGGCPLPTKPRGDALGSVLSVPLAAAPSQRATRGGGGGTRVTRVPHAPSWRCGRTPGVIWVQWHRFVSATAMCAQSWFNINQNPILALANLPTGSSCCTAKNLKNKTKTFVPFLGSLTKPPQTPDCAG